MIYSFQADGESPFNEFLPDSYDQKNILWNSEDDLKRFFILYPNYCEKHPEQRDYNRNSKIFIDNDPFEKISVINTWEPLKVELYSKAKSRKIGDISSVDGYESPIFSEKAKEALSDLLEGNGEFLEINCTTDGKTYYLYHVLTYVDIIDPEKTYIDNKLFCYFKENVDFDKLSIFRVIHPKFCSYNYISQKFVDRIYKYKLKGLHLGYKDVTFVEESVANKEQLAHFKAFNEEHTELVTNYNYSRGIFSRKNPTSEKPTLENNLVCEKPSDNKVMTETPTKNDLAFDKFSYFEKAFENNFAVTLEDKPVTFENLNMGKINIHSGKIIAGDLITSEEEESFTETFPTGKFDIELSIIKYDENNKRVGFSRIKFSEEIPVRWEIALSKGQNSKEKDNSGYGVDSASAGFIDAQCYEELLNHDEYQMDVIDEELEKSYKNNIRYYMWEYNDSNGAFFSTGFGDGHYYTYIGYDKNKNICRLVTDFDIIEND